ncbi:hypothetical protein TVAG_198640 [Trichomonas vaginalis G3]|uniref:Uncharacterized protein n=1 Tax=Trichomonas vaginalis (strain ATCC PRA-98 / G3) TaxID=412133 RepID=A2DDP9_TRIV3|nr:quinoprotein alcohol dehydrogenase-like family [Trichomonas vaginalis G3]EAY21425.1 hypothetical protein TVAG_198640 [Trichomonas vaginalis G3]KAI5490637.1 quinoprotein alcohol dehydrogenase-like family [Trichomonas vaginalis G3]|eukprot:XP_001582411.1 hypothetical protein [Trichomonas vaginalis G3]
MTKTSILSAVFVDNMRVHILTDHDVKIINYTNGKSLAAYTIDGYKKIAVIPNSNILVCIPKDDKKKFVNFYDTSTSSIIQTLETPDSVLNIVVKANHFIVCTSRKLIVYRIFDFEQIQSFDIDFSHDKLFDCPKDSSIEYIAYADVTKGVLTIANYLTGSPLNNIHVFKAEINYVQFSQSGRLIAILGENVNLLRVYSFPKFEEIATAYVYLTDQSINSLTFNATETTIIITTSKNFITVVDFNKKATDEFVTKFDLIHKPIYATFDIYSNCLYSISQDGRGFKVDAENVAHAALYKEAYVIQDK